MDRLPLEVIELCLYWCDAEELLALSSLCRALYKLGRSDKYWKLLYWGTYKDKPRAESADGFLGGGFFRAFYQESLSRRVKSKVGRQAFSLASGGVCGSEVKEVYSLDDGRVTAVLCDGNIAVYEISSGEVVHRMDTKKESDALVEERDTKLMRSRLSSAHRNKLFAFKTREYEGAGFDIWQEATSAVSQLSVSPIAPDRSMMKREAQAAEQSVAASPLTMSTTPIQVKHAMPLHARSRRHSFSSDSDAESASIGSYSSSLESMSSSLTSNASLRKQSQRSKRKRHKHRKKRSYEPAQEETCFAEQLEDGSIVGVLRHEEVVNMVGICTNNSSSSECLTSDQRLLIPPTWVKCSSKILCVAVEGYSVSKETEDFPAVVTGHEDGVVLLWNSEGKFLHVLHTGHARLSAIRLSPQALITADVNGFVQLWEPRRTSRLVQITSTVLSCVVDIKVSGQFVILACDNGSLSVWLLKSGKLCVVEQAHKQHAFVCMDAMKRMLYSADEELHVVTGGADRLVKVRKFRCMQPESTQAKILGGHTDTVRQVHIDPHKVVSCSDDGTIRFWDLESNIGKLLRTFKCPGRDGKIPVRSLAVLPDMVIGGRVNGAIFGFKFSNKPCTNDTLGRSGDKCARSSSKKGNRSKYKQHATLNVRATEDYAYHDDYMDILYDDF